MQDLVNLNGGKPSTTSLVVAERFGKRHDTVLRAIRNLECSPEFNARNFAAVEYIDGKNEKRPMYFITRDGFAFLAMGFTGKAAMAWKEKFLDAFNRMEAALSDPAHSPLSARLRAVEARLAAWPNPVQRAQLRGALQAGSWGFGLALATVEQALEQDGEIRPLRRPLNALTH